MPAQELIAVYAEEGEIVENDVHEKRVMSACLLGELKRPIKKT